MLFTCPIMHAKTLSYDDHKRMNRRSKKIYKHPQKSCIKDSIKSTQYTQCLHCETEQTCYQTISTKQGIVQNPVSHAPFSYKK